MRVSDYKQNDNNGVLFRNNRKQEGSKQPDYNGNATVGGVEMDISAWVKEGKNGGKFLSLSFRPKDERRDSARTAQKPANDEGIPF